MTSVTSVCMGHSPEGQPSSNHCACVFPLGAFWNPRRGSHLATLTIVEGRGMLTGQGTLQKTTMCGRYLTMDLEMKKPSFSKGKGFV